MEARALRSVLSLPGPQRLSVVAEGLRVLDAHVTALRAAVVALDGDDHGRGAAILDGAAVEEAGKVFVLLDWARAGGTRQRLHRKVFDQFYDHVARGIQARAAEFRPATFGEIVAIVEQLRVSHYLDGPNDVDWVFRNTIETQREESLYVDYVRYDDGAFWVSPDDRHRFGPSPVTRYVSALGRTGLFTARGLAIAGDEWKDAVIERSTRWAEVERRNLRILERLQTEGLSSSEADARDFGVLIHQWGFPLFDLDLSKRQVPATELDDQRRGTVERFYRGISN